MEVFLGGVVFFILVLCIPFRFRCTGQTAPVPRLVVAVGWPYGLVNVVLDMEGAATRIGIGGRKHRLSVRVKRIRRWLRRFILWRYRRQRARRRQARPARPPSNARVVQAVRPLVSIDVIRMTLMAVQALLGDIRRVGRRVIRLQRFILDGEFGSRDPAWTGMVYGWSRAIDGITARRFTIRLLPNFYRPVLAGSLEVVGIIKGYLIFWLPFVFIRSLFTVVRWRPFMRLMRRGLSLVSRSLIRRRRKPPQETA